MPDAAVIHAAKADDTDDRLLAALEPMLERYRSTRARREHLALMRAVRLAPDIETCEELLRTGRVPRRRLDPEWQRRYGL